MTDHDLKISGMVRNGELRQITAGSFTDSDLKYFSRSTIWHIAGVESGGFELYTLTFMDQKLARIRNTWTTDGP